MKTILFLRLLTITISSYSFGITEEIEYAGLLILGVVNLFTSREFGEL